MERVKVEKDQWVIVCGTCGKKTYGYTIPQARRRMSVHKLKCDKENK